MRRKIVMLCALLLLCMLGGCSACGQGTGATTMHLVKTTGTVAVSDAKEKAVSIIENLGLHDGYCVATEKSSYAWINLDDVKLTKMDADSNVTVQKDGKKLEMVINAGNLYFNVTKPLDEDETMNIRTSNMIIGIRGTEGWVELLDENRMRVSLLSGKVECTIVDDDGNTLATATIEAGETADMIYAGEDSYIYTDSVYYIPDFVEEERNARTSADKDSGSADAYDGKDDGPVQENVGDGSFSIAFGNITITQLPVSWSEFEKDGWMITDEEGELVYAVNEDNYISFRFQDGSSDLIDWIYIANANTRNGYFNINDITLFGNISFADSTTQDITNVLSDSQYDLLQDYYDSYYFELKNIKGFTSICLFKESDTDFVISMSCAGNSSQGNSEDSGSTGSADSGNSRPKVVETRFYSHPEDDFFVITVEILDNDSWSISWNGYGAQEVYTGCTREERESGTYVQVNGYNHTAMEDVTGEADLVFMGYARFSMTEEVLTIEYEDADGVDEYYRKYY